MNIIHNVQVRRGLLFQGAAVTFTPLTSSDNAPTLYKFFASQDLARFFNTAFTLAVSLFAIIAVLRIAYGGWKYMSTDAFGQKSDAREIIRNAVIGLLLLLGIWIILNQINPCLLDLNILRDISGTSGACSAGTSSQTMTAQSANQNSVQVVGGVPAGTSNVNGQTVDQNNNPLQTQPM